MQPVGSLQPKRSSRPSFHRTMGVCLILAQALTLTILMKPVFFSIALVALLGWLAPQIRLLFSVPLTVVFAVVAAISMIVHQFLSDEFANIAFIGSKVAFEIALGCIFCQLGVLFVREYEHKLPSWFLAASGTSMVFAGDVRVSFQKVNSVLAVVMIYIVCWVGYAISCRTTIPSRFRNSKRRRAILVAVVVLTLVSTAAISSVYKTYANRLEHWISEFITVGRIGSNGAGFSGTGGLSSISDHRNFQGFEVALKIDSDYDPGYMRGKVFTKFEFDSWTQSESPQILSPLSQTPSIRFTHPNDSVYLLNGGWPSHSTRMTIWPFDRNSLNHLFVPLDAAVISTDDKSIKLDYGGTVERDGKSLITSYVVLTGEPQPVPMSNLNIVTLSLPDDLEPVVHEKSKEIFQGLSTTREKIQAVEAYFSNNYTYSTKFRVPRGANRLSYFLTTMPAAHCEYFATAATILLRTANVHARYVTGYVTSSRNPIDGSYLAYRKDAHAWVEAYDEESESWITVEPTPVEGIPQQLDMPAWTEPYDAGKGAVKYLFEILSTGVIWHLFLKYKVHLSLLLVLAGLLYLVILFSMKRLSGSGPQQIHIDKVYRPLQRELRRMDRFLTRMGMSRQPDEGLLYFADRIERDSHWNTSAALANWYRQYTSLRYQDVPFDSDAVAHIKEIRRQITKRTKAS
ncbi:transglutaminase-like domain-containing protein [Planctomicrobium sp. SH668]|uniref:transglutaminase-like domain-containing protein n=1 Tax=Planctomicrobium sp. SH668 TaxID=3448126 RepID=UPI003F5AF052